MPDPIAPQMPTIFSEGKASASDSLTAVFASLDELQRHCCVFVAMFLCFWVEILCSVGPKQFVKGRDFSSKSKIVKML